MFCLSLVSLSGFRHSGTYPCIIKHPISPCYLPGRIDNGHRTEVGSKGLLLIPLSHFPRSIPTREFPNFNVSHPRVQSVAPRPVHCQLRPDDGGLGGGEFAAVCEPSCVLRR